MDILKASALDIENIIEMAGLFFNESKLVKDGVLNYDKELLKELLLSGIKSEILTIHFVKDCGFLIWSLDRSYSVEWMALLFLFYVHPKNRGTPLSRMLWEAAIAEAKYRGAVVFYGSLTSDIDEKIDTMMENTMKKYGFSMLGRVGRLVL
jgi:GNAT superfamily N-acetyltransferase